MSYIDPEAQLAWDKVKGAVRQLAYRMVQSPDEANAIENTVYFIATRNYYERERFSSFIAYALTITRNEALKVIKDRQPWSPLPEADFFEDENSRKEDGVDSYSPDEPELILSESTASTEQVHSIEEVVWNTLKKARDQKYIKEKEYVVVTSRLELHDFTWAQIADTLGISADNCMTIHSRALGKLQIYLFMKCPNLLGGFDKIKSTFDYIVQNNPDYLLPAEIVAFRQAVLLHRKLPGTTGALQSACNKLIRKFFFKEP